ncbi:MAG TPA: SMI1/KNR4 family protein [Fimbriimonadaceae bacterium]|nr:SMI1/KNR4 family protein [Fimbriimonadaceae bacterium]
MSRFYSPEELSAKDPFSRTPSEFARYYGPPLTDEMVASAEQRLGVRLPAPFLALLHESNGGFLRPTRYPCEMPDSWGEPYAEYRTVHGLGYGYGIDAETGALHMRKEWGYPDDLLWLDGDGHTGLFLDYRTCGSRGEPPVVYVDVETDGEPIIWPVATTFGEFLAGLREESE